ncbi:MAG TPA: uracil-DNA glycosylase [Gammaproteobacteria bacterium]|nr:uracil-DNA glycosylase [Gammaproteobacteria bacterium]
MDVRREAVLGTMGFTRWVQRNAPEPRQTENVALPADRGRRLPTGARVTPIPVVRVQPPAREAGTQPAEWERLESEVSTCTRCALAAGRTRTVFGLGARDARWMFVGEGPGAEEDRRGEPFVGRAGQLLDAMLAAIGLARRQVYIANVVKCRPPGNRDPLPEEADACWPYLRSQIAWVNPALVIALGAVAARRLLGVEDSLGRLRGRVHEGPDGHALLVTYHPAYLLRNPAAKREAWQDLKLALATASPLLP